MSGKLSCAEIRWRRFPTVHWWNSQVMNLGYKVSQSVFIYFFLGQSYLLSILPMDRSWGKAEKNPRIYSAAHLDEKRISQYETQFLSKAYNSLRFYLFCSSLPLGSCSQCASITQRLIFLSINQCKAPCVRHALWVSAWLERIHIYLWDAVWNS